MLDDSFDLNFSDSGSTKKLFNTSNESSKNKNKGKLKSNDNSYSQNSISNYSQTSQSSNSQNQKKPKFSHVFVTIYKYERLYKCQMQTLFARIRFHPKISIIQTNNSICISNQIDFNCSYALDFSSIPPFSYQDFTPVIELYRRISNRSELVGISLLPLKEIEQVSIQKKKLTYFYHNSRVPVKDIMTGGIVGTLVVSIGFGFPEHQSLFNPNFYSTYQNQPSIKINSITNQIEKEDDENDNEEEINEKISNKNHHNHHHHHKKKKSNQWQKLATAAGWKPPDFVSSEWKTKAIKRGWIPPEKQLKSSIAINCKKEDIITKESISTQYDPILLAEIENNKNFTYSSTFSDENHNDSDDELKDIINFLNPRKKKKNSDSDSSQLSLTSPSTIFQKEFPKLCLTPVMNLLDVDAESDKLSTDSTDDSDTVLHNNVNDLINNVLNCQKTSSINQKVIQNENDENKLNDDSNIFGVSSDILNDKKTSDSSSGSSSASNVKKCLCNMDVNVKKILDIYGIENDFF